MGRNGPKFERKMPHGNLPHTPVVEAIAPAEGTSNQPDLIVTWRFKAVFGALSVLTVMIGLDATAFSVALPIVSKALQGNAIETFWCGTSFLLTETVFQPVLGSLSDIFGRKPVILTSIFLFAVGIVVASMAQDIHVLLVGRAIQGAGAGGLVCLVEIIVTDMVPLRLRGKWISICTGAYALGSVSGPILGGGFSENFTWRWIFWFNLPFVGIAVLMVVLLVNLKPRGGTIMYKLRRVDWVGATMLIASLTGFLVPVTWGGVMIAWKSWRTLVPLIVSAFGLAAFILWQEICERRFSIEPLVKTAVFKSRQGAVTYLGTFFHGLLVYSMLYYLPLYYQAVKGFSPIGSGVALFPQTFPCIPASVIAGIAISKTGRYRPAIYAGWGLTTLGMGLLAVLKQDTSMVSWIFLNLFSGIGTGILFSALSIAVQASSNSNDMACAVNMNVFLRSLGQAVGVAIGGVIFQNRLRQKLLTYPLLAGDAAKYSEEASSLVQVIRYMPSGLAKIQLIDSYVYGLRLVWIVMTVLSGVSGLIALWGTKNMTIDHALETEQGFEHRKPDMTNA